MIGKEYKTFNFALKIKQMKYNCFLIFCLICFCCAAQEVNDGYVRVILDGKEAYMSIETGEITSNLSPKKNTVKATSTVAKQSGKLTHIVQKGETLYAISKKYDLSVNALSDLNGLKDTSLSIGQVLNVKTAEKKDVSTNIYTVKKGDTLYSISKKFAISVSELKNFNNLNSNSLSIGQQLKIK